MLHLSPIGTESRANTGLHRVIMRCKLSSLRTEGDCERITNFMKKIMYCIAQMQETDKYVNAMHIDFKSCFWYDLDQAPRPHAAQVEKYAVAWEQVVRLGLFHKPLPGPRFSKPSKYVAQDMCNGS